MKAFRFPISLVLVLLLTACGASGPSTNINVEFTDFKFTPDAFSIPAGETITLNATNNGKVEHEYVIMKYGLTIGDNFGPEDEDNIYWEVEVLPGADTSVTFTAPTEPGEYQIVCGTEGHFVAGMVGSLTVVAP